MRLIRTRRIYYLINIAGLAMGIASAVLIMLWIADELSYEKMHEKADNTMLLYKQYMMGDEFKVNNALPYPLAPSLLEEIPEIKAAARVVSHSFVVSPGKDVFTERNVCATDNSYFDIFSFKFISGDPKTALTEPHSIVISREKAEKYFGDDDPMGRILKLDRDHAFTVTGVIENINQNTYLDSELIIPFETIYKGTEEEGDWYSHFILTYIYLESPGNPDSLNSKLTRHIRKYMTEDANIEILAQPIRQVHLNDLSAQNTRKGYLYIFAIIGFLIILIACINFTNVSTSLSVKRSREIGIKKVNGAHRAQLIRQFFGEAFHQAFASFLLAMMLVELLRPHFNQLTGKVISIPYFDPFFLGSLAGVILLVTLLAGSYPALLISAFRPIDALQGRISTGKGQVFFRTALLVFQFTISIGLIISTLTINEQIRFIQKKNMGFQKENLMYVPMESIMRQKYDVFREELLSHALISNVCRSSGLPTSFWSIIRGLEWEGRQGNETVSFALALVDEDFFETMELQILDGRDFSREFSTDSNKYMINEAAAKVMGYDDPVGKFFLSDSDRIEIIGLFKDFNSLPLTYEIEPMLVAMWRDYYNYVLIRIRPGNLQAAVDHVEKVWKKMLPGFPFNHGFVDARIERQYRNEQRIGKLSGAFTLLAIMITCIGLFAIAAHTAQQRTKEIGVRKAMGASAWSVVLRFIMIYLKWVLIANLVAWPLAWLIMDKWLDKFAFRSELPVWIFLSAGLASVFISVFTISFHAWNISRSNPVNSLRYE